MQDLLGLVSALVNLQVGLALGEQHLDLVVAGAIGHEPHVIVVVSLHLSAHHAPNLVALDASSCTCEAEIILVKLCILLKDKPVLAFSVFSWLIVVSGIIINCFVYESVRSCRSSDLSNVLVIDYSSPEVGGYILSELAGGHVAHQLRSGRKSGLLTRREFHVEHDHIGLQNGRSQRVRDFNVLITCVFVDPRQVRNFPLEEVCGRCGSISLLGYGGGCINVVEDEGLCCRIFLSTH